MLINKPISKTYNFGEKCFFLGIFFLATAPFISCFFFLISLSASLIINKEKYFEDKWNYPFIYITNLMILSLMIQISNVDNSNLYSVLFKSFIGLLNWIPFFVCFWGFQIYLRTGFLRKKTMELFVAGSIPVLITGFGQYFFKWYGPWQTMNGLIIWFQKPINPLKRGLTGLFSNQNYTGCWISLVICFALALSLNYKNYSLKKYFGYFITITSLFALILTSSRNAFLNTLLTLVLYLQTLKSLYILIGFFFIFFILLISNQYNIFNNYLTNLYSLLPEIIAKKLEIISFKDFSSYPRLEIWGISLSLVKEKLLFGYGIGEFKDLYLLKGGIYKAQHSHNLFLNLTLSYGLPSAIILLGTLILLISKNINKILINFNSIKNIDYKIIDKGWTISSLIFICSQIFDITYFDGRISMIGWILMTGSKCTLDNINEGLHK